ncbi:MAG: trypsin-like peptidase domain-containing protein [Pirellulaceae bacterium]
MKLPALTIALLLAVGLTTSAQDSAIDGAFAPAVEYAQARTVKIFGAGIGRSPGYATGLIVSPQGEILTTQGVFLAGDNLRVTLADGTTHGAQVVRRSQKLLVALLKIDTITQEHFELPAKPVAAKGDWILGVSNAFKVADGREPLSVNIGVLSLRTRLDARRGYHDFLYDGDVYLIDAITSNPGAAGGAVVNAEGKLVGMVGRVIESRATNTRLNYAIPADLLKAFVEGKEEPPLVASADPMPPGAKAELGLRLFALGGRKSPAYIDRVIPGSPAAQAGLKSDDLIVAIDGQVVRDGGDYRRIVETLRPGNEVVLEVKRKNDLLSVKITPAADR